MAHQQQRDFIQQTKDKFPEYFTDVNILEVGSLNINGTVRDFFKAKSYTGIDLIQGTDVDLVSLGHKFNPGTEYDIVISTECFEHDVYFRQTFLNMIRLTRHTGMVLFTCATDGRHEHGTTRTSPADSPGTNDYYMNINENDFFNLYLKGMFSRYSFEYNGATADLYFWGIKNNQYIGIKDLNQI